MTLSMQHCHLDSGYALAADGRSGHKLITTEGSTHDWKANALNHMSHVLQAKTEFNAVSAMNSDCLLTHARCMCANCMCMQCCAHTLVTDNVERVLMQASTMQMSLECSC